MKGEMQRRSLFVGRGRAALVDRVAEVKARDPLARVWIVVPNGATAEAVRDGLGCGRALVNVHIMTVEKAALEVSGACGLALPSGAERLVMRRLLEEAPAGKPFRKLAGSAGFLGALAATLRDLVDAGLAGAGLEPPPGSSTRLSELLALARAYEELRGELALDDDSERFARATERLRGGARPADCVFLCGLYDATGLQEEFLVALLGSAGEALALLPGHPFAAGFQERLVEALGLEVQAVEPLPVASRLDCLGAAWEGADPAVFLRQVPEDDGSVQVFSMPGGEVGALLLARHVAALLDAEEGLAPGDVELVSRGRGGLPGESVARELERLGVPVRRGALHLGECAAGRVVVALVGLLGAPRVAFSRVMDLAGELFWREEEIGGHWIDHATRAAWDRLGRRAGVRVAIDEDSKTGEAGRLLLRAARKGEELLVRSLLAWIDALASLHRALHAPGGSGGGWGQLGGRLVEFLETWLRPDTEGLGAWRVRLYGLARLDELGVGVECAGLGWVISGIARESTGQLAGEGSSLGVRIGKLAGRRGARARHVFLLDGDEGSFPRTRTTDVLLGDGDRRLLGARAPGLLAELDFLSEERALFGELCSLATERLVLVTSRPGIEGGTAAPSRFVAEALGVLGGDRLREAPSTEELLGDEYERPELVRFDLDAAWRGRADDALGVQEGLLFGLEEALGAGLDRARAREVVAAATLTPESSGACEAGRRRAPGMSAFDGQLSPGVAARLAEAGFFRGTPEQGLSASRLETFAGCGMRSLLGTILGVEELELPEESRGILASERGTRVHSILERFGRAAKAAGLEPWSDAPLEDLKALLFEAIAGVIKKARKEAPADQGDLWEAEAARYRGLLLGWLKAERREPAGWKPEEFEWRFDGIRLELGEGAPLYLRGVVDRVDLRQLGGAGGAREARIVDYKTGKGSDAKDESTHFGRSLQLALYGAAARSAFGASASSGLFDFVFSGKRTTWSGLGKKPSARSSWCRETDATAFKQVELLVEAMEAGVFWPTPRKDAKWDDKACGFCGMREACGPWREDAKRYAATRDPLLAELRTLMARGEAE